MEITRSLLPDILKIWIVDQMERDLGESSLGSFKSIGIAHPDLVGQALHPSTDKALPIIDPMIQESRNRPSGPTSCRNGTPLQVRLPT